MTKGELESKIGESMIKLQREQLGRGADSVKTFILKDMVIVRMSNSLTAAEKQLSQTVDGKSLIKEIRTKLEDIIRPRMESIVQELTGVNVKSIHTDISTKYGERIDIFILSDDLEEKFLI